jgi:allantoinase
MIEKAIRSRRVVTPGGEISATVLIGGGKIVDVIDHFDSSDIPVLDLGNEVVMPGLVDPHVHINEPGRTEWEGFETATRAAAAGGLTTLVDMPLNSSPVTTSVAAFEKKREAAKGKLHSHCGFWGGVIPGNVGEIEGLVKNGVLGFKAFLTHSGIDEFPNITEDDLRKALPLIVKHGLPLLVHCELETKIATASMEGPGRSYSRYLASRPESWEQDAIDLVIRLCEEYNCRVHIVHLSSAASLKAIADAKHKGLPLTVETAQHYLYFSAERVGDGQTLLKCAPPIRSRENNERLWEALQDGLIDFVATDHSPAPPSLKEIESGDFGKAWGGISSLQFALPVLWTVARKRAGSVDQMARWLSEKPAGFIQFGQSKGRIAKGYDADLLAWDPDAKFVVRENMIYHRHAITPYLGEELFGVVKQTFLAGETVYDQGRFVPGRGSLLLKK